MMIQLPSISSGRLVLVTKANWQQKFHSDVWGTHPSTERIEASADLCASGKWICYFAYSPVGSFVDYTNYPCFFVDTFDQAVDFVNGITSKPFRNIPPPCPGLLFNYIYRHQVFDKVKNTDWSAWLGVH
jgi:hypothetical protein